MQQINKLEGEGMKMKKWLTCVLAAALIMMSFPTYSLGAGSQKFFLRAGSFADDLGTWRLSSATGSFDNVILYGLTSGKPDQAKPAKTHINISAAGKFNVWVRTRDYATDHEGSRFCTVRLADGKFENVAGKHGNNGFRWENIGQADLPQGSCKVELVDSSGFFCRFDSIFITDDLTLKPSEDYTDMLKLAEVQPSEGNYQFKDSLEFPLYAKSSSQPIQNHTIQNQNIKLTFYEVQTDQGNVIQCSESLINDGKEIPALSRQDDFGYLLMRADKSAITSYYFNGCPVWTQSVSAGGIQYDTSTGDIFKSGLPSWLIPSSIETVDDQTVILHGENPYATISAKWTLPDGAKEPLVTCTLTLKQDGFYSLGMFGGPETPLDKVDYLLAPLQFVSKFLPPISALVSEVTSTDASSIMTVNPGIMNSDNQKMTYGIAIDPSSIPYRWAYTDNQKFGLGIRGMNGGVQPYAFAPVFGMRESQFKTGDTYEISYRPTVSSGEWYDTYRHVVSDIFKLRDMRKNYYASITDTVFNLQDLIMNDKAAGWSDSAKGFANMEIKGQYKQPTPLTVLQQYLLTDDVNILEKRAIPTMAYLLTRHDEAFNIAGGSQPMRELGSPTSMYSSNIFSGMYYMSRGLTPIFRKLGITTNFDTPQLPNIPSWCEQLYRYNITGDKDLLEQAKTGADAYIENTVYHRYTDPGASFYALNGYPYYSVLLDLYEATGENKYLNAASESAHQLLTSTWTQPLVPDGNVNIDAKWIQDRGFWSDRWRVGTYYWNGLTRWRLGNNSPFPPNEQTSIADTTQFGHFIPMSDMYGEFKLDPNQQGYNGPADNIGSLQNDTVPAWVPSRIGWSIEGSSYFSQDSTNIPMTSWAGDLIRLSQYTGDNLFETIARNEIVGRAASYPGYYIGKFLTNNMKEDYPYTGPDITNIYYHHIPVYLGMVEDFLFAQSWKWSNGQINFPAFRQYGYVWFDNKVYGFGPGKFFDESGMWPCLKKGDIQVDNMQIDWLGAKKDGVFGAALMNEDTTDINAKITLGNSIAPNYTGAVTLYMPDGTKQEIQAHNGIVEVSVPAKSLVGIKINSQDVKAPSFSNIDFNKAAVSPDLQTTATAGSDGFGTGYVLQMNPSAYYAYVFVPYTEDKAASIAINYSIGGGPQQVVKVDKFPFESIIKVDDVSKEIKYNVEVSFKDGTTKKSSDKVLTSLIK